MSSLLEAWTYSVTNSPVTCDLRCHDTHVASLQCYFVGQVVCDMIHAIQENCFIMPRNHLYDFCLIFCCQGSCHLLFDRFTWSNQCCLSDWISWTKGYMLVWILMWQKHCGSQCWQYYHWFFSQALNFLVMVAIKLRSIKRKRVWFHSQVYLFQVYLVRWIYHRIILRDLLLIVIILSKGEVYPGPCIEQGQYIITAMPHEHHGIKWSATRLFIQQFLQADIKGNIKVYGGFTSQRANNMENVSWHDSLWWYHL